MASDCITTTSSANPPSDMISELPKSVIETILMRLPLRDAARTSILARKWRYNWVTIPRLVFDDAFCQGLIEDHLSSKDKLMRNIYEVLSLHRGPIVLFTFSVSWLEICSEIDWLILFLSRSGVQKLNLHIVKGDHYRLPASFFSCVQLRSLDLCACEFKAPHGFNGFSKLVSLHFYEVNIDGDLFGKLVSNCPLLEEVVLDSYRAFDSLQIDAPMLKFLCVHSSFNSIHIKHAPVLASFLIPTCRAEYLGRLEEGEASKMIEVFRCLPAIQNLSFGHPFVKFLAVGGVPKKLPFILNHLKILTLNLICFLKMDEVSFLLCLIRSSPNLVNVKIYVERESGDYAVGLGPVLELFKEQNSLDFSLNQLREVRMLMVSGARPELEFMKLILARSPMLEKMVVFPHLEDPQEGYGILKELIRFRRVSPKAEIICLDKVEFYNMGGAF